MCPSSIKEKFIFLASFNDDGSPTSKKDIEKRMPKLSQKFFNSKTYAIRSEWIKHTVNEHMQRDTIIPVNQNSWIITNFGRLDRDYSFERFVEPSL